MSASSESVRWNACAHRLDLGIYSHPKEFGVFFAFFCFCFCFLFFFFWGGGGVGMESEPMLREKSPLPEKFSSEEDRTHDAASSGTESPTHYQRAFPAARCGTTGKPQHSRGTRRWCGLTTTLTRPPCPQATTRPPCPQATTRPPCPQATSRPPYPQATSRPPCPQATCTNKGPRHVPNLLIL